MSENHPSRTDSPIPDETTRLTKKETDNTIVDMEQTMLQSASETEDELIDIEDYIDQPKVLWLPYLIKHLVIMIIGGIILSVPIIIFASMGQLDYGKVFSKDDPEDVEEKNVLRWARALTWATGMLVITTFVSFIVSMLPRFTLFLVRIVASSKTELVKQYLEFYTALTTTIKVVVSMSIAFGMWCLTFPSSVYFDPNAKVASTPTIIIFRVLFALLVNTLIIAIEKILIQIIAVRFHRTAYRSRLDEATYATYVLDKLNKARKKIGSSANIFKTNLSAANTPPMSTHPSSFNLVSMNKVPKDIQHTPSGTAYSFPKSVAPSLSTHKKIYDNINKRAFEGRYEDDVDLHSKMEARRLAAKIFSALKGGRRNLVVEDFFPYFPSEEDARKAFDLFDKDKNGDISRREMRDQIGYIYKERKDLALALADTSQAVGKLDKILLIIFLVVCAFVTSIIFGKDIYTSLIPFGTFFLGLSFIFGENAKQLFQSIIFLFVMHPYDSGDRIYIDKDNYLVQKVGLLGSKFTHVNGQITYIPHSILLTKIIYNIRRSPFQAEQIDFQISFDTPKEKILELKNRINNYINEEESREFFPDPLVALSEIVDSNKLNMFIWLEHKGNWQDGGRRWARKTRFMIALREICNDLGLSYALLPQKVILDNPTTRSPPIGQPI